MVWWVVHSSCHWQHISMHITVVCQPDLSIVLAHLNEWRDGNGTTVFAPSLDARKSPQMRATNAYSIWCDDTRHRNGEERRTKHAHMHVQTENGERKTNNKISAIYIVFDFSSARIFLLVAGMHCIRCDCFKCSVNHDSLLLLIYFFSRFVAIEFHVLCFSTSKCIELRSPLLFHHSRWSWGNTCVRSRTLKGICSA